MEYSEVLVVDLPEEIEVTRIAIADARERIEQLVGHILPFRLARASIHVDVAHGHELVVAQIRPAIDLDESRYATHQDFVEADESIDIHAPSGPSPRRRVDLVTTIGQIEFRRPVGGIPIDDLEVVTVRIGDEYAHSLFQLSDRDVGRVGDGTRRADILRLRGLERHEDDVAIRPGLPVVTVRVGAVGGHGAVGKADHVEVVVRPRLWGLGGMDPCNGSDDECQGYCVENLALHRDLHGCIPMALLFDCCSGSNGGTRPPSLLRISWPSTAPLEANPKRTVLGCESPGHGGDRTLLQDLRQEAAGPLFTDSRGIPHRPAAGSEFFTRRDLTGGAELREAFLHGIPPRGLDVGVGRGSW